MIIENLSNRDYHKRPEVSNSDLNSLAKAPAKYKYRRTHYVEPSDSMKLGSLAHTLILEPEKFGLRYTPGGERLNWTTREGKEQKAWCKSQEEKGLEIVWDEDLAKAEEMALAVHSHVTAGYLLAQPGKVEASIFTTISEVPVKCRPDKLLDSGTILDVKTTRDASLKGFGRSAYEYRYHQQMAFYQDVVSMFLMNVKHRIISIESDPPYLVQVFDLDQDAIMEGREDYLKALEVWKQCNDFDVWPGYSEKVETLYLPPYAYKRKQSQQSIELLQNY